MPFLGSSDFSGSLHHWLVLHSLVRAPSGRAVLLVSFAWIQFAYVFPMVCLMCVSFAVYLCTKSSADLLCGHLTRWEENGVTLCFQLGCGSSELCFGALFQALTEQDRAEMEQIMQLLIVILLSDMSFAKYTSLNVYIFKFLFIVKSE